MTSQIPDIDQLHHRHSSKWRRFDSDVLPMHVAEMDFEISPYIRATLARMVTESDLGYLGPIPELNEAVVGFAKRRWNWNIDSAKIRMATDVGVAAVELFRVLTKPGEKVVINSPVYTNFHTWIPEVGAVIVDAPLNKDAGWRLDLAAIDAEFSAGARVLLLCNPQNPTGTVHSQSELAQLADIAAKHGAVIISDEIHAPLTYADSEFVPYLSVSDNARKTGIVITSSSKSWNTAGLKAAIVITASDEMQSVVNKTPEAMHWRASLLGAFAMVESYGNSEHWLNETVATLNDNRHFMLQQFAEKLPAAKVSLPAATYLAWVDVSDCGFGSHPAGYLLENGRVGVEPGTNFGKQYGNYVRFNFATSQANIAEAITRMASVAN
ncbi:MAG: MalY/PatB family protein [Micrococcales bacterium]